MNVLNTVKLIRWERGLSLRELSKASGVSYSTIYKVENFIVIPNQLTMLKISKGLSLEVPKVFNLDWHTMYFV